MRKPGEERSSTGRSTTRPSTVGRTEPVGACIRADCRAPCSRRFTTPTWDSAEPGCRRDHVRDDPRHSRHHDPGWSAIGGGHPRLFRRAHEGAGKVTRWSWTSAAFPQALYRGSRDTLHLTERFTRVGDVLHYEVTVDDPHTWTKPWTAALELAPQPEGLFEYACHEGNNSMRNILSAARAAERRP